MEHTSGTTSLANRARLAIFASWAMIVISIAFLVIESGEASGLIDPLALTDTMALYYVVVGFGHTAIFVTSVVLVAMWIYRAHANLIDLGNDSLEFTPGWAVGWYFVPFANLFKPFQAMRELWTVSMGQFDQFAAEAPGEVKVWWGCWIVGNILSNVSLRMSNFATADSLSISAALGAVSSLLIIAAAWYLIGLIRTITAAQRDGLAAVEVFS